MELVPGFSSTFIILDKLTNILCKRLKYLEFSSFKDKTCHNGPERHEKEIHGPWETMAKNSLNEQVKNGRPLLIGQV